MTRIRTILRRLSALRARSNASGEKVDEDAWVMRCPCGTTVSVWNFRRLTARLPSRVNRQTAMCPSCRKRFVGRVQRLTV